MRCELFETGTRVVEREKTDEKVLFEGAWNVVVYNDPVNLMSYVTRVFQKVFGYSKVRATELMLEVHHHGRAIVWSGARERAELYVQQLQMHLLLAAIEKQSRGV